MAKIFSVTLNRESSSITLLVLILKRMISVFQIQCHLSRGILVDLYEMEEISSFYYIYLIDLFFLQYGIKMTLPFFLFCLLHMKKTPTIMQI